MRDRAGAVVTSVESRAPEVRRDRAGPATPDEAMSISAPGSALSLSIDEGIATITIDQPGETVNVLDPALIENLGKVVDSLPDGLAGVIIASGKEGQFVAGADLRQVLQAERPEEAMAAVRALHRVLNRLAGLPVPSVAAINGPALGGGLEIALACDYRVCVESDRTMLGLPEVRLGLLPAGGGSQRLPRLIGLSRALGLILEGKHITPRRARRLAVIDEVVHPAVLMDAARAWLRRGKRHTHPRWSRLDEAADRWRMIRRAVYWTAERNVRKATHVRYTAPLRALDTVRAGREQGLGAGLAAEAVAFGELATGDVAHNLIGLFLATEALKREQRALRVQSLPVDRTGLVGAGFMGAEIAQSLAVAGYGVRVRDVKPEGVARGLRVARDLTMRGVRRGRFARREGDEILSRLSGSVDYSGFRRAGLVIEAVFEDIGVKRKVIGELEDVLSPDAVIASNTSSLPIADIAAEAEHPQRIVGMHFFSPVHRMPLLEVVRGERTSDETVATAIEAGARMGKTVIVVQDGPGFYTTRTLTAMLLEAGRLFEEGVAIDAVDRAMTAFGFPVGPLALIDEVGLDVAAHILDVLQAHFPYFRTVRTMRGLVETGRLGRKSGGGFYNYGRGKKRPSRAVYAMREARPQPVPRDLIQRRLVMALLNEAARCLDEGIVASPRDADVGAVLGFGFPPFLGGPFRYADSLGLPIVLTEMRRMAHGYGELFNPAPLIERMAESGARFREVDG